MPAASVSAACSEAGETAAAAADIADGGVPPGKTSVGASSEQLTRSSGAHASLPLKLSAGCALTLTIYDATTEPDEKARGKSSAGGENTRRERATLRGPLPPSVGAPAQLMRPPVPAAMDESDETSHGADAEAAVSGGEGGAALPLPLPLPLGDSSVTASTLRKKVSCAGGAYASATTRPIGGAAAAVDCSCALSQSGLRDTASCEAGTVRVSCTPPGGRPDDSPTGRHT